MVGSRAESDNFQLCHLPFCIALKITKGRKLLLVCDEGVWLTASKLFVHSFSFVLWGAIFL